MERPAKQAHTNVEKIDELTQYTPSDVRHCEKDVAFFWDDKETGQARGTLYITESRLVWWDESKSRGVSIPYRAVMIHAISRDPSTFQRPCIYLQLDSGEGDVDNENPGEIRFVPENYANLDTMYSALSDCQALHPDSDNDSDGGELMFDGDMEGIEAGEGEDDELVDDDGLNAQGRAVLARLEGAIIAPFNQDGQSKNDESDDDKYADAD